MRIIAGIILIIVVAGGIFWYKHSQNKQNPIVQYDKIIQLPSDDQVSAVQKTVQGWIKDPVSALPYPKGWRKVSVTTMGETFDIVTPDETDPPQYYVSFVFPKKLIPKMHLIKCWGTKDSKTTDVCAVGDNPTLNAYFNIMDWFKNNPITNPQAAK